MNRSELACASSGVEAAHIAVDGAVAGEEVERTEADDVLTEVCYEIGLGSERHVRCYGLE